MVPGLDVFCGWGWEDVGDKAVFLGFADFFLTFWVCFVLGVKETYDGTAADGQVLMDPFSDVTPRST